MKRDPDLQECTRDPIFLLEVGKRQWTEIPDGCEQEDGSIYVVDRTRAPDWLVEFADEDGCVSGEEFWEVAESTEGDNGWPFVYVVWRTERVFFTRKEAEEYGARRRYRWDKWRVFCVPAEGRLRAILDREDKS